MRALPRTHGVGGQITRVTIAGCNRLQSADAIRGAFHAPSELETLLHWIRGTGLQRVPTANFLGQAGALNPAFKRTMVPRLHCRRTTTRKGLFVSGTHDPTPYRVAGA